MSSFLCQGREAGSSPLTRGKLHCSFQVIGGSRLIPAHAGKTVGIATETLVPRAHPRSRGENLNLVMIDEAWAGSSPLTRGKLGCEDRLPGTSRLIPAHAGKTSPRSGTASLPSAHPRSRGENLVALRSGMTLRGSSPLTRGKRRLDQVDQPRWRLIPAHAGKTSSTPEMRYERTAHPRSRGENASVREHPILLRGSSPLTRGKLVPSPPSLLRAAHPRSRGENATSYDGDGHTDGSSPLTRGKLHQAEAGLSGVRLIPAHAGKTTKTATFPPSVRAHPRSRGENRR